MSFAVSDVFPSAKLLPAVFMAFWRLASVNTGNCFCGTAAISMTSTHVNANRATPEPIGPFRQQGRGADGSQAGQCIELARAVAQFFDRHAQLLQDRDVQIRQRLFGVPDIPAAANPRRLSSDQENRQIIM